MPKSRRLSKALSICVLILLVLNILAIPLIPGLVVLGREGGPLPVKLAGLFGPDSQDILFDMSPAGFFFFSLLEVWYNPAHAMLTAFLLICALCSALILWQGLHVLRTVRDGLPFQRANERSLRFCAVCCFVMCGMAFVRCVWSCLYFRTLSPLFTYNALFIPVFLMAGLLLLVMASLFGQAAELREENDLTI